MLHRIIAAVLLIGLLCTGIPSLAAAQTGLQVVEDLKDKDDLASCGDGIGRSFTSEDLKNHPFDGSASASFWNQHMSCFQVWLGAGAAVGLAAICSGEEDVVLRLSTPDQMVAPVPGVEDWVVCAIFITNEGPERIVVRAEDFEIQRNAGGIIMPSEDIEVFIPEQYQLGMGRSLAPEQGLIGLLAFDVEPGWIEDDFVLNWWETADQVIVDRTDIAPVQLLAGNPGALPDLE